MSTPAEWMTPAQVAEELGLSERTVKQLMAQKKVPSVKFGGRRFWTPECRSKFHADQGIEVHDASGWGRPESLRKGRKTA